MSWQMAVQAGQAGLKLAKGAVDTAQGINDTVASGDARIMSDKIKAAQGRADAANTGLLISGTQLQTSMQETQRRRAIANLWQANAISLVGRGGVSDGMDSAGVISDYNLARGQDDIDTIKLMGESKVNQLSFRQTQQNMFASSMDMDALNTGDLVRRQVRGMATDMLFKFLDPGADFGSSAASSAEQSSGAPTGQAAADASAATVRLPVGTGETGGYGSSW